MFYNCVNLTHINLEEGLESIGESSFRKTAIEEISIPASVKTIGNYAFSGYIDENLYHRTLKRVNLKEGL